MKILGHGIDVVCVDRFKRKKNNLPFLKKIFTPRELKNCLNSVSAAQKLAARFAAKEAFLKAMGTGWAQGVHFLDVEIKTLRSGKPQIQLTGPTQKLTQKKGIGKIFLSMAHESSIAIASVILSS